MNEFDWIEWIQKKAGPVPRHWIGIGDDAAVLSIAPKKDWVVSTDAIVEGVDFDCSVTPSQAGRKALAINLSDLAAMGAHPEAFLMTLGVPKDWGQARLKQFILGVFRLAREYRVVCVGGDMSSAKQFFCSITVMGSAVKQTAVLRRGAKPGDVILVTGSLGGSIYKKHYAFTPRIKEGEWLIQHFRPSALMDVSDGLAQDLGHLLRSSGCSARIDLEKIPVSKEAKNIQSALSDGEDFELLMTMNTKKYLQLVPRWKKAFPGVALTAIGSIAQGTPQIHYFKNSVLQKKFHAKAGFRHF